MIICEAEKSDSYALKTAVAILLSLGSNIVYMNAEEHDMHLAYVSHLSHISSFVLGSTVLEIEQDEKQILNLAGTGFASTVRLAKSHPSTWTSIFLANKDHLLTAIDHYINEINMLKKHIEHHDHASIYQYIEKANLIRKIV
jgi:prephenate dehydrogenase